MIFAIGVTLLIWCVALSLVCWGTWLASRHLRDRSRLPQGDSQGESDRSVCFQAISILKPVKGAEPGLRENLRSFFALDYPEYELIFSVANVEDPATEVIREVMQEHPGQQARFITGEVSVGANPKVNNLMKSYAQARHNWILISDSNVRVSRDYLQKLAAHFTPDVGVVTAVVAGQQPKSLGGYLEAVFLNTFYARWMLLTAALGQTCVLGKSMLFRKSDADRFGGLATLGRYLAEDYMAGQAMRYLGYKLVVMSTPVAQPIGQYSFVQFWQRHLRWGRIRKSQAPIAFFFEPWIGSMASGLVGALGISLLLRIPFVWPFLLHMAVWFVCDLLMLRKMKERPSWRYALSWLVREVLAIPLWLHISLGRTVNWRGQRLRVQRGGMLERPS